MARGIALAAALSLCSPAAAWAQAFRVESSTQIQVYHLRTLQSDDLLHPVVLDRRRMVESLWLEGYELITGQDLGFEANVRVFDDFGVSAAETTLDGVRARGADLLYANASFRIGGFEARAGRQVRWEAFDGFALDGVRLRYRTPWHVGLEAYGGLWVKGSSFLGSPTEQLDGTRAVGLRVPGQVPPTDFGDLQPTYGARLFVEELAGFDAAVEYRRSTIDGQVALERAAAEVLWQRRDLGLSASASADIDLVLRTLANLRVQARYDGAVFGATAEVDRYSPILTLDSIWYWFTRSPRDEASLRAEWLPPGPFRAYARGDVARLTQVINPELDLATLPLSSPAPSGTTAGGAVGGAVTLGAFDVAADFTFRRGGTGNSGWLDLHGSWRPPSRPYALEARLSYADVRDGLQPLLQGKFFGAQVRGAWALSKVARLSLVLEQNVSALDRSDTRAFAQFDLGGGVRR
ncbi:MAG TPA: hypothetical protein VIG99_08595 [Myxococcaceae bacterium]|jgi:hypothetical protein